MNDNFKPIDADFSDEDIISVDDKLFEIKQFKEASKNGLQKILFTSPGLQRSLGENLYDWLKIVEVGLAKISGNLSWESETIDGKVLRLGSKNWQKIKLKFRVICILHKQVTNYTTYTSFRSHEVFIEYCLDELEIPESPLDEMRKALDLNS